MILAVLLQTTQVDLAPTDPAITVTRIDSTYSVAVTNNTTHDIAGLAVAWLAGGPPRTLILDSKQPVVPAKGTVVLTPPAINPIPTDRTGRRLANPSTLDQTYRIVIEVDAVLFDDGHLIGRDSYGLVANITARTELATAEAKWAAKKPQVYEFTYKQICFCPPPPPGTPGYELIVFRVINGVGYLTGAWADRPQARQGLDKFSAVEKQFAFIREELAKHPYEASVEYDSDDGHPKRVRFNAAHIADGDYGFTVEGFTPLTR